MCVCVVEWMDGSEVINTKIGSGPDGQFYPKSLPQKNDVEPLVVEKVVVVLVVENMVVVLVVEGSDEQNDEVTDGTRPSWWRPLTECRPLYSTLPRVQLLGACVPNSRLPSTSP